MTAPLYLAGPATYARMLKNARTWIDKAAAHAEHMKFDAQTFMTYRLAPDQFGLARQIQVACDHAKSGTARLAGVDVPRFEDNEANLAELQARIDKTVAFVESVDAAKFEGAETRDIRFKGGTGIERQFIGADFLHTYSLPNFYFHITTAYAILRHSGLAIGKVDYLSGGKKS